MKKILLMLILILSLSSQKSSAMNSPTNTISKLSLVSAAAFLLIAIAAPAKAGWDLVNTISEKSGPSTNPTHRTGINNTCTNNRRSCSIQ